VLVNPKVNKADMKSAGHLTAVFSSFQSQVEVNSASNDQKNEKTNRYKMDHNVSSCIDTSIITHQLGLAFSLPKKWVSKTFNSFFYVKS